jgi:hypothetical protein
MHAAGCPQRQQCAQRRGLKRARSMMDCRGHDGFMLSTGGQGCL